MTQTVTSQSTQFYQWKGYRCAYRVDRPNADFSQVPLVLVHPIGVGLSKAFWDRFCDRWQSLPNANPIYNPDLLGCGESDMPHIAYTPADWAQQLQYFLKNIVGRSAILVVQGALFPVAIKLVQIETTGEGNPDRVANPFVKGLVLSGPPSWPLITKATPPLRQKLLWNLFFDSLVGRGFYRYARRREFLRSFSVRQLFDRPEDVGEDWLRMLENGASNEASRYAVFSFLAGFWRENYQQQIEAIAQPTLVVMGEKASSISKEGERETPDDRLNDYLKYLPKGEGTKISGRNVMPYETPGDFATAIVPFVRRLSSSM